MDAHSAPSASDQPSQGEQSSGTRRTSTEAKLLLSTAEESGVAIAANQRPQTSLIGCFDDMETCCIGWWCPCLLFGMTLRKAGLADSTCRGVMIYMCTRFLISMTIFCIMMTYIFIRMFPLAWDPDCVCPSNSTTNTTVPNAMGSWMLSANTNGVAIPARQLDADYGPLGADDNRFNDPHGQETWEVNNTVFDENFTISNETSRPAAADAKTVPAFICPDGTELPPHCLHLDFFTDFYILQCILLAIAFCIVGAVFGHYRKQVYGSALLREHMPPSANCSAFWIHCFPYTHLCALCQEARSVNSANSAWKDSVSVRPLASVVKPKMAPLRGSYGKICESV